MIDLSIGDARERLSELVNRVAYGHERIMLSRHGKNIAVVIPLEDLILLEEIEDQFDLQDAKAALREAKEKGSVSLEMLKKKLNASYPKVSRRTSSSRRAATKKA